MAQSYVLYLEIPGSGKTSEIAWIVRMRISEAYNTGWIGIASVIVTARSGATIDVGAALAAIVGFGLTSGKTVLLRMALYAQDSPEEGLIVRTWPCVIGEVTTKADEPTQARCDIELLDPISYLASRRIWGAYRDQSVGAIVGGALSLATGGDGKPGLAPVLPGLPRIRIAQNCRDALSLVPYAVAAGEALMEWLAQLLGTLGVRLEMKAATDETDQPCVAVTLSDNVPTGAKLGMTLAGAAGDGDGAGGDDRRMTDGAAGSSDGNAGMIHFTDVAMCPVPPMRAAILDDIAIGSIRAIGSGAVGSVHAGGAIDVDEAFARASFEVRTGYAEELMVRATSRQPGLRPGRVIELDRSWLNIEQWQIVEVSHVYGRGGYHNVAVLLRCDAELTWHPRCPAPRAPRYVSAVVDGGEDHDFLQPVERDRLGRVPVSFSFLPTPSAEEQEREQSGGCQAAPPRPEARKIPFAEEQEQELEQSGDCQAAPPRLEARKIPLAEEQALELEQPGGCQAAPPRPEARKIPFAEEQEQELEQSGGCQAAPPRQRAQRIPSAEAQELARPTTDADVAGLRETPAAPTSWPPRIPLPVLEPMAGGMHGFLRAHRHGDICRVVVHSPFVAEIIGFQYRIDRTINAGFLDATTGFVVEHDSSSAWSGILFQPVDRLEDESSQSSGDGGG